MKRIFTILVVAVVLVLSVVPAFASSGEEPVVPVDPTYITVDAPDVYVTVEDNTPIVYYSTDAGYSIRSAFTDILVSIFGEYSPRTQTVTTCLPDGTVIQNTEYVTGVAGLDWVWLTGAVLFCIVIYCIFRMIGGVLKWS